MNNMAPTAYYNWVFQWTVSTYTGLLFCELFVMLVDQQLLLNTWYVQLWFGLQALWQTALCVLLYAPACPYMLVCLFYSPSLVPGAHSTCDCHISPEQT